LTLVSHYPQSAEAQRELERRVAAVHAQAAGQYIQALPIPKAQKLLLLRAVKETYQSGCTTITPP